MWVSDCFEAHKKGKMKKMVIGGVVNRVHNKIVLSLLSFQ